MQSFAQTNTGVGTITPGSKLTVNGSFAATYRIESGSSANIGPNDFYVAYNGLANGTLTLPTAISGAGNFLGRVYHIKNTSTSSLSVNASGGELIDNQSGSGVASINIPAGFYAMLISKGTVSGTTWEVALIANAGLSGDATRLVGGTVGVKFNQASGSTSTTNNPAAVAPLGGIDITIGTGYTVNNPSNGIFVITFNSPYTQIYGVSTNIVDAYGTGGLVTAGTPPNFSTPGTRLQTNDNTQISLISNTTVRVKTGDNTGNLGNRPFTFLVTGR